MLELYSRGEQYVELLDMLKLDLADLSMLQLVTLAQFGTQLISTMIPRGLYHSAYLDNQFLGLEFTNLKIKPLSCHACTCTCIKL